MNSCVAFALSSFLETVYKGKTFSTGFIYGYRPLGYSQEEGMYPREAMKTLKNVGDCQYKFFEHNKEMKEIKELVDKDIDKLKSLSSQYEIKGYARINSINEIKDCIIDDTPVPVSIPVYGDIELDENNIIQITDKPISGYHMILIYGWNEYGFLIQNSWGKEWGNNGTAILPYEYTIDSAWAISTEFNHITVKKSIWQRVVEYLKFILEQLQIIFLGVYNEEN